MKNDIRIFLLISAFIIFCSCSESTEENYKVITKKKAQTATERTVRDLRPVDSLNLTKTFTDRSFFGIELSEESIVAKLEDQIAILNKLDLNTNLLFTPPEGRGPGEIIDFNTAKVEAGEDVIAVYDGDAKKTALYDLNGNFREEFLNGAYQVRQMDMADEQTYYIQLFPGGEYLFCEVKRTKNESVDSLRFQKLTNDVKILAYDGSITYHNQSLYFGGYSEPLIRRYDLSGEKVELAFSRAVIDDYNSENNYLKPDRTAGGSRFWQYAEDAQFASEDVVADDNYLYSVRHRNDREGYKYLDIYDVKDGSYQGSFVLQYYPTEIAVDENYIYTKEEEAGESTKTYLMKYEKPEMDF